MKSFEERLLEDECFGSLWEKLDEKSRDAITDLAAENALVTLYGLWKCESPIEWLLGVYLDHLRRGVMIEPQEIIETNAGTFRVDFLLTDGLPPFCGEEAKLIVECDGHDYHEKTKEQAAKEKSRDRALKFAGYEVIHFTGSEIWANPMKRAREALDQLQVLARR